MVKITRVNNRYVTALDTTTGQHRDIHIHDVNEDLSGAEIEPLKLKYKDITEHKDNEGKLSGYIVYTYTNEEGKQEVVEIKMSRVQILRNNNIIIVEK